MIFTKRLRDGVRRGEITCSIRIWQRPRVSVGKRYRMEDGAIEVEEILPIRLDDITPALARASGFKGVIDLLKVAKHGRGENVYLVRFHFVPDLVVKPGKKEPAREPPSPIAAYIRSAPPESQAHMRRLYAILRKAAPGAEETIKWGTPFFVEPRFVFAFSAHKAHLNFAPTAEILEAFRKELKGYATTKNFLQIPYDKPLPEDLIRRIAERRLLDLSQRDGGGFW